MSDQHSPTKIQADVLNTLRQPLPALCASMLVPTKPDALQNTATVTHPTLGQRVKTLAALGLDWQQEPSTVFAKARQQGIRFVLLGSETPPGKWLNDGRPGNGQSWQVFLKQLRSTPLGLGKVFQLYDQICVLGCMRYAHCQALQPIHGRFGDTPKYDLQMSTASLQCQQELGVMVGEILKANLIPICISGGHEDILGMGLGFAATQPSLGLCMANLDAHADFKNIDNRGVHSGNGFQILNLLGIMQRYAVLGLSRLENRQSMLEDISQQAQTSCFWRFLDEISLTGDPQKPTLFAAINHMTEFLCQPSHTENRHHGLSVCLDIIEGLQQVSCPGTLGLTPSQCVEAVRQVSIKLSPTMLLITEAMAHGDKIDSLENRNLGKLINHLLYAFLQAHIETISA